MATSGGAPHPAACTPSVLAEPLEVASPNRTRVSETFVPEGFAEPAWGVVASTQIGGRPWGWNELRGADGERDRLRPV